MTRLCRTAGVTLALVAACGDGDVQTITAADGRPALLADCYTPAGCYRLAAQSCPAGYHELSHTGESHLQTTMVKPVTTYTTTCVSSGALLFRCGKAEEQ